MSAKFFRFAAAFVVIVSVIGNIGVVRADHSAQPDIGAYEYGAGSAPLSVKIYLPLVMRTGGTSSPPVRSNSSSFIIPPAGTGWPIPPGMISEAAWERP